MSLFFLFMVLSCSFTITVLVWLSVVLCQEIRRAVENRDYLGAAIACLVLLPMWAVVVSATLVTMHGL